MTINDVEKIVNLTKKSIRYYEEKGLITPTRLENDYRDYSDEDVQRLKYIKVYRYIGFSIKEIEVLLNCDETKRKQLLQQKVDQIEKDNAIQEEKQDLCLSLIKKSCGDEIVDRHMNRMEYLESEEYQEVENIVDEIGVPNLAENILLTINMLVPILWLGLCLIDRDYENIWIPILLAFIGVRYIEEVWKRYFKARRLNKGKVKTQNKKSSFMLLALIFLVILGLILALKINDFYVSHIIPSQFLFYQFSSFAETGNIALPLLVFVFISGNILGKFQVRGLSNFSDVYQLVHSLPMYVHVIAVGIVAILYYLCLTSFCVVTPNQIIYHSPLHPTGLVYDYQDVESVDVSFKGDYLQYQIYVDGHSFTFDQPQTNDNPRYEDLYIELEDFDKALVDIGVKKTSSLKGIEDVEMDQQDIERYQRIANNK